MKSREALAAHLSPDEIVDRVFPLGDGAAPVPIHLAVCAECQERVARLREAWLLDRGAVVGAAEAIPEVAWNAQTSAVMRAVREAPPEPLRFRHFPKVARNFFRRPVLAFGSLAAALLLVGAVSVFRPSADAPASPTLAKAGANPAAGAVGSPVPQADAFDDELLLAVDAALADETPFASLVPEGA